MESFENGSCTQESQRRMRISPSNFVEDTHFLDGVTSGIFTDKIGRAKPVLMFHIAIYLFVCVCFMLIPHAKECITEKMDLSCFEDEMSWSTANATCEGFRNQNQTLSNLTNLNQTLSCHLSNPIDIMHGSDKRNSTHFDDFFENWNITIEKIPWNPIHQNSASTLTAYTNTYRFFDVLVSDLTNDHNSDFGRQRVWSVLGGLIGPPVAGVVLNASVLHKTEKHYSRAFLCSIFLVIISVFYMESGSKMRKPATKMWKSHCSCYHLFWVTVIQYADEIAPEGLQSTLKVLAGTLHFNIGRILSAAVGVIP
ncbi:hypothetical protein CEXT_717111 [Caerostris extrusa]|uniref:Major facilitator superfamily associated domain-containing protein n=1 Tax=Caerostris extrusa TaxID=172846 RepID=A0AAV4QTL8_CAEEX|nr:hypothetical protein CEXT_717111 [Caerostris extrusa]